MNPFIGDTQALNGLPEDYMINLNLVLAREDFCGALVNEAVTSSQVEEAFVAFKCFLKIAFFDERSPVRIGETASYRDIAEALIVQVGCLATVKSDSIKVEDVEKKIALHAKSSELPDATLTTLSEVVQPYMPVVY